MLLCTINAQIVVVVQVKYYSARFLHCARLSPLNYSECCCPPPLPCIKGNPETEFGLGGPAAAGAPPLELELE